MAEAGEVINEQFIPKRSMVERAESRTSMRGNQQAFLSYDTSKWEHTYYNDKTGGYVVTELARIPNVFSHQNEFDKFQREQEMCEDLADFGFGVKHLYEPQGTSSPDAELVHGRHSIVEINGKKAELKKLVGANNLWREAKDAFKKKKADLGVFKFVSHSRKIGSVISKIREAGWHGMYYYEGEDRLYEF